MSTFKYPVRIRENGVTEKFYTIIANDYATYVTQKQIGLNEFDEYNAEDALYYWLNNICTIPNDIIDVVCECVSSLHNTLKVYDYKIVFDAEDE